MDFDNYFIPASEVHVKKEKNKAREMRQSQFWKNLRGQGNCYYCKGEFHPHDLTMDHIVPVVRGGRTTKGNIVACCKECNSKKSYMLPIEWQEYIDSLNKKTEE